MLACHPDTASADAKPGRGTEGPTWIDLFDPTPAEAALVEKNTGLRVPSREDLNEIESTSRIYVEKGALYLSTPLVTKVDDGYASGLTSAGFILTPDVLVTIRYERVPAFGETLHALRDRRALCSSDVFTRLLEVVVDRAADLLEFVGGQLDKLSHEAFRAPPEHLKRKAQENPLRERLRELGRLSDRLNQVRAALHGVARLAPFVAENVKAWAPAEVLGRLGAVKQDVGSLNDFEAHLSSKVAFLLDAVLGFISIEQNDVVKLLTVVSVVGVPPVLVAGVYGMNFKFMPELDWHYGYPFAMVLMVLSGVLPLVWFRWRGWV